MIPVNSECKPQIYLCKIFELLSPSIRISRSQRHAWRRWPALGSGLGCHMSHGQNSSYMELDKDYIHWVLTERLLGFIRSLELHNPKASFIQGVLTKLILHIEPLSIVSGCEFQLQPSAVSFSGA